MNDLKFAIRQLLKNPGFTAVAVLTLALGIGATTAIFNVGNALLLRPLPFKEPDQLFALTWQNPTNGNTTRHYFIHPVYEEYRNQTGAFLDLIAYSGFSEKANHNGQSERIAGQLVSVNFFSNLGITPILGRGFLPEDEQSLEENPIIISHGLWQRHFHGDTNVVGQSFSLGTPNPLTIHTVIGVAPPGLKDFPGGTWDIDAWTPRRLLPGRQLKGEFPIMARLAPGVSRISAQTELDRITRHIEDLYRGGSVPGYEEAGLVGLGNRVKLVPAGRGSWGPYRSSRLVWNLFALFMGAVGLVLLIACANVANLLLVRAVKRRKEIAVRLALGASRVHLVRQLIVESLVLSCIAGALGLLLASWCGTLLQNLRPASMVQVDLSPDIRMFSFALVLSVLTGLIFGLAPALQAVKFNLHPTLKNETLTLPGTSRGFSLRNFLVITQMAVCLVLLVGAGLCLRNFWRLQAVDAGFSAENVLIVPLDLSEHGYSPTSAARLYTTLRERLSLLPGVRHVSFAGEVPLGGASRGVASPVLISDYVAQPGESMFLLFGEVGPGYFQALGIPLVQGREFTSADRQGTPQVAIINEALARRYWPGQEPMGKLINYADGLEVVGVIKDLKFLRLWETPEPFFYMPMMQMQPSDGNLIIKTEGNPWPFLSAVRNEIRMLDKNLTVSRVRTLEQIRSDSLGGQRFTMILLGLFAGMALLIAAVGLYGVIAYVTSQRTREIGVRMALGAGQGDVLGLVVRQAMGLVLMGVALGIASAIGVTRFLSGILHGVSPTDLATFCVVSLILALVALTACYLPARRAAKTDPMEALRYE